MSNKRKNIEESLLPGLDNGGGYSPAKVIQPGVDEGKKHTKISIHTVSQFYGDNKQLIRNGWRWCSHVAAIRN